MVTDEFVTCVVTYRLEETKTRIVQGPTVEAIQAAAEEALTELNDRYDSHWDHDEEWRLSSVQFSEGYDGKADYGLQDGKIVIISDVEARTQTERIVVPAGLDEETADMYRRSLESMLLRSVAELEAARARVETDPAWLHRDLCLHAADQALAFARERVL